ncbi:MAG: F0F1 ATP synthase subunit B [bacterium]|nr:F0F1 ATP synthase subunit B [bacterium]
MKELGIDLKMLFGQIVNFAILLFLLKRFAFKPFLSILEKRKHKIEEGIKKSEEAENSLGRIRILAENFRQKNEKDAREMMVEAEARAKTKAEEIMIKVEAEKKKAIEEAKQIIRKEGEAEMKRREKEMIDTTFILTEKFLKEKLDESRDKKIIEDLIANLK